MEPNLGVCDFAAFAARRTKTAHINVNVVNILFLILSSPGSDGVFEPAGRDWGERQENDRAIFCQRLGAQVQSETRQ